MAEVKLYNIEGKESGKLNLPDALFAVAVDPGLVHEVIIVQEANGRSNLAHTKDRSEVRGGGRKPWRQKGTGRARHGSRRSPIWSGGGVTFGPRNIQNFFKKINKKVRRKALAMLLSDKVADEKFIAVEDYKLPEAKTIHVAKMRAALPGVGRSTLIITTSEDADLRRAAKNVPKTETIGAKSLNARDLAKYEYVVASKAAIEVIKETYSA
ncbi:MAG: 50S ribosomal protein L4 [Patescibacteria group bacterium]